MANDVLDRIKELARRRASQGAPEDELGVYSQEIGRLEQPSQPISPESFPTPLEPTSPTSPTSLYPIGYRPIEPRQVESGQTTQETPFQNWARRLIMGPMPLVHQQLADAAAREREAAKQEWEESQFPKKLELATAGVRLGHELSTQEKREIADMEMDRRRRIGAVLRKLGRTEEAELFESAEVKPEEAKILFPPDTEKIISPRQKIIKGGKVVYPTGPPEEPRKLVPFEDYNPVTQETFWNEEKGIHEVKNKTVNVMELLASEASRLYPKDQGKQEAYILQKSLERENAVSGERAKGAYPYRPLTEIESHAVNWIEMGQVILARLAEYRPEELSAMSGLFNRTGAEVGLFLRGALPQLFGSPTEADARFAGLKTLLAEAEDLAFERGGKQLTPMERRVVMGFVPNRGDLTNTVLFKAKTANLSTSLMVIKEMRLWRLNAPRGVIDTVTYDAALARALQAAGIQVPDEKATKRTTIEIGKKSIILP